jgi:hypothetical protein
MRKILIFGLCVAIALVAATAAMATTVTLGGSSGVPQYAGVYVGPIGGTLDGATEISGGIMCVDVASTSYFGSKIEVTISTLEPQDMKNARFGWDEKAIFKYEEAAWLLGQIPFNPNQVGELQFAVWRIFDQTYVDAHFKSAKRDIEAENSWMKMAAAINPKDYDFSSVCIYTPTADYKNNQEFMSGGAAAVPVPSALLLLGAGLVRLVAYERRKRALA